jgi:Holliday junction resolvase RusA-like endonuclease
MIKIEFLPEQHYTVMGVPIPLARARIARNGHHYDPHQKEKKDFFLQIRVQHKGPVYTQPMLLSITFFMPIPQGLERKYRNPVSPTNPCIGKCDIDNLLKFVLDSLQPNIISNDNIITSVNAKKIYSELPRTELTLAILKTVGESKGPIAKV